MRQFFLQTPWAFGLFCVSGLAGLFGSYFFFMLFRFAIGTKTEKMLSREFLFTGILTGVAERFFFTFLIGLLGPTGIAQATVAWVAIKGQVHYKMFSDASNVDMPRAYLGLLGSIASLVFAIAGGYVWKADITAEKLQTWYSSILVML